jgi:hypothetical protein
MREIRLYSSLAAVSLFALQEACLQDPLLVGFRENMRSLRSRTKAQGGRV